VIESICLTPAISELAPIRYPKTQTPHRGCGEASTVDGGEGPIPPGVDTVEHHNLTWVERCPLEGEEQRSNVLCIKPNGG